jgi:hyperosmotically inducible protein
MRHVGYVTATLAALAAGSAWAADNHTRSDVNAAVSDSEISRQVASDLIKDTAVGPYGVRVESRDGMVHMSGSVGSINDWMKADEDARNVEGVAGVQNDLSVLIR